MLFGLLLVLGSLGTVRALDQAAMPGGAPEPKRGPFRPSGFVRVVDGESIDVVIDGRRTGIGILGVDAPTLGTPCGAAARAEVQSMLGRGVVLEDDPANQIDLRKRRMYRVTSPDGRSVAAALVGAGLARTTGLGPEAATLAAAEAQARQQKTGCVWGGPVPTQSAGSAGARFVAASAAQVPANFVDEVVASGLSFPTAFAFLPDGRVLVAEKEGKIRLVTSGGLQPTPVMDITSRVNNYWDRGTLGLAVDPSFGVGSNRDFYVFYTFENQASDFEGYKSSQLARFSLQANSTADPTAGVVILGTQPGAGCAWPPSTADCIPAENWSHAGGALRFGTDGKLFISTGDAASYNFIDALAVRAQLVDSLAGKILRVDTNGKGLDTNPRWNGNADHPISKVWAWGFRNPFRMIVRPSGPGGALFVGDVGWGEWEEIDRVTGGMNAGWPCYEGNAVQGGYRDEHQLCRDLIDDDPPTARGPLLEWGHNTSYGLGGAALIGAFYTGTVFPSGYQGALFYADYAHGWVKSVRLDTNNQLSSTPETFAEGIPGPVQIESGPDGALWYLAIGSGELRRIRYVGNYTPIQCPDGQFRAEYFNGQELNGVPVVARCEPSIDYDWAYGSPANGVDNDHFSARWTGRFTFGNDTYDFTTTSDDGVRLFVDGAMIINDWVPGPADVETASKVITAGEHTIVVEYFEDSYPAIMRASWTQRNPNSPPTPTITSPAAGAKFKVGDIVQLQGSAPDAQQGQIPSANLRWDVIQKHCPGFGTSCHDHPLLTLTGATSQFTAPDHGDGSFFEIRLTATDSGGLTGVTTRQMDPQTVQVTLVASPSVGTVVYDGSSHTPPYTTTTIAGSHHSISAQPPADRVFGSWTHGGAQQQTVTVGEQNVTYTAIMGTACSPRPRVIMASAPAGADARQVTISTSTNPTYPTNTLKSIQFLETRSSTVEAPGTPARGAPFTITSPNGATQATFTIRRSQPGAVMVRFTVTDDCGAWNTFIGSGSTSEF